ncbi:hypothetical protein BDP27DRAFT_650634 [Rhodocollybia butyracea]|uniref:Uncharacterized protein n=1 Tax=Rhodocollybia butyracea TaxID=206335 RepID=A0A9P5P476_9AGAR|nr:hypothetical protein BDP27DRAFT_650634 [Rhodocollybia butyracea]
MGTRSVYGISGPSPVPEEPRDENGEGEEGKVNEPTREEVSSSVSALPKVPEKDRFGRGGSIGSLGGKSSGSVGRNGSLGNTAAPAGGRRSFDSFSNAVNTALPESSVASLQSSPPLPSQSLAHSQMTSASTTRSQSPRSQPIEEVDEDAAPQSMRIRRMELPPTQMTQRAPEGSPQSFKSTSLLTSPHSVDLNHSSGTGRTPTAPTMDTDTGSSPTTPTQGYGYGNGSGNRDRLGDHADRASVLTSPYSIMSSPTMSIQTLNTFVGQGSPNQDQSPNQNQNQNQSSQYAQYQYSNQQASVASAGMQNALDAQNARDAQDARDADVQRSRMQQTQKTLDSQDSGEDLRKRYESVVAGSAPSSPSLPDYGPGSPVARKGTPMAFMGGTTGPGGPASISSISPTSSPATTFSSHAPSSPPATFVNANSSRLTGGLGRKPSGARAPARYSTRTGFSQGEAHGIAGSGPVNASPSLPSPSLSYQYHVVNVPEADEENEENDVEEAEADEGSIGENKNEHTEIEDDFEGGFTAAGQQIQSGQPISPVTSIQQPVLIPHGVASGPSASRYQLQNHRQHSQQSDYSQSSNNSNSYSQPSLNTLNTSPSAISSGTNPLNTNTKTNTKNSPHISAPNANIVSTNTAATTTIPTMSDDDDVFAVLSYLDVNESEEAGQAKPHSNITRETVHGRKDESGTGTGAESGSGSGKDGADDSSDPDSPYAAVFTPSNPGTAPQYKSSFAPSKQAAERKAKAQATLAAQAAAAHRPGARSTSVGNAGMWFFLLLDDATQC